MASMTESVAVVTRFPLASFTCILMAGEIAALASASEGWTLKASWLAAPAVMLKPAEVAEVRPEELAMRV